MTNPDADPTLAALFAEPMREVSDDERALKALLAQIEHTDRRRGFILAGAGVIGALLATGIIAATNGISSSLAGVSTLSMRVMTALAQTIPDRSTWSLPEWLPSVGSVPDGSLAIGLGFVALVAAAIAALEVASVRRLVAHAPATVAVAASAQ